ncbi:MAG: ATP-binding protein [Adlercreutzia equolifaciens]
MEGDTLSDFIDDVCGESRLRVEDDLGDGFVRLRSSEAERRQAAQDIRSSEDVVIELLRNARDAGASRIFLATQKTGNARLLTVLDDGQGIPAAQHERIFEPRVTSKLDSAHMDKWGMHGRGMALYSISVNAEEARVLQSEPGLGTTLTVATDTESLPEKADQSTFPRFEQEPSGSWAMRGPKNIVRTAAEFALEHRGDLLRVPRHPGGGGSDALANLGLASLSPGRARLRGRRHGICPRQAPRLWPPAPMTCSCCEALGLPLSERSARRDARWGHRCARPLNRAFGRRIVPAAGPSPIRAPARNSKNARSQRLAPEDIDALKRGIGRLMEPVAGNVLSGSGGRGGGHRGPGSHPHHRSHPHVALWKRAVAPLGCNR